MALLFSELSVFPKMLLEMISVGNDELRIVLTFMIEELRWRYAVSVVYKKVI